MEQLWPECGLWLLKAAVLGAVFAVDGQAAVHAVGSQPLVVGALTGWALGDPAMGLTVGAYLQLVWLYAAPRGRGPGPDPGSGTIAAVVVAMAFAPGAREGYGHLALAMPAGFAVAGLGAWSEVARQWANRGLSEMALKGLLEGKRGALGTAQALGLVVAAARGGVTTLAGTAICLGAGSLFINLFAGMDFGAAFALIPCVGLGSVLLGVVKGGKVGLAGFAAGLAAVLLMGLEFGLP